MKYRVTCVCGGYGFPISASAARIIMVGRALEECGIPLQVLHCGPSPISINRQKAGVYQGIPFRYTTSVRRPENRLVRILTYMWGLVGLTLGLVRLWPVRRSSIVYLYVMDGVLSLYTGALCQLLGLVVVQELCEWTLGQKTSAIRFNEWLYRRRIFRVASGALVISKAIEERVRQRALESYPHLVIHRVPVMVDAWRFAARLPGAPNFDERTPTFVYCGTYLTDVFFLLRSVALVRRTRECKLMIIGQCGARASVEIVDYWKRQGLSPEDLILVGFVDEHTLEACYKSAAALLMPLWNDDKSITRLPNKMGEYLASGRPVVTSKIGDLTEFLADRVNAYVAEPGGERAFADKMIDVLEDPSRAARIGAAGRKASVAHLDYRVHAGGLGEFFIQCIERRSAPRSTQDDLTQTGFASMAGEQADNKGERLSCRQ